MPFTRSHILRLLRIGIAVIIVGIIAIYAVWRSLNYARGPEIDIYEPINGSSATSSTITVRGLAQRINTIYLNGRAISIDEQGNFKETVLVFPGLNSISLHADDQFGRHTDTTLTIMGTRDFLIPQHAQASPSTTPATTTIQ